MIKTLLKKLAAVALAAVTAVTALPAASGDSPREIQTLSYQNEAVNDNDISYETATFVNFDAAAWTFINAAKNGTWMYIKSYKNSNQLMQPVNYEGTYVNLWDDGGAYKQWQFEAHDDYFYIKNMNTGKYLWFDALKNGAAVNAETVNPGWNNRFKLVTDQRTLTFSIRPYADTRYCVEIGGRDSSMPQQADRIQIWTYQELQNQKWNITVDDGEQLNGTLIYDIQNNPQGSSDYNYPKNGVIRGMAQTMIDKMDFKFNSIKTAYDLFGDVDANTSYGGLSVYQEVNSGYKFPFKIDEDGYRYFDSKEMYVTKNDSEKKFNLYNGSYDVMYHDVTSQYDRAVSNAFVPYNTPNFTDMDYGFTMCMEIKFFMENDGKVHVYDENGNETEQSMIFEFTGDDDLWIYIDDKLCLDMGGIHGAKRGNINFESRTARTYFDSGDVNTEQKFDLASGEHTLRVFYMERAQTESNLKIKYNLISKNNLKIDPNGGSYRGKIGITDYGERLSNEQIRIQKPSRKGYVFAGWDVQGSGRLTADNSFYYMGYNDTTLVAQWKPNEYNLNFDYNCAPGDAITGNEVKSKGAVYGYAVGELPKPQITGKVFGGWYREDNGKRKYYNAASIYDVDGDMTLKASWSAEQLNVFYHGNGGSYDYEDTLSYTYSYADHVEIHENPFLYDGDGWYEFGGWALSPDGEVKYNPGDYIDIYKSMDLYAVWKPMTAQVRYNANGGTGNTYTQTVTWNGSFTTAADNTFTKEGYALIGWDISPAAETPGYKCSVTMPVTDEVFNPYDGFDLYAVWEKSEFKLTFDYNRPQEAENEITGNEISVKNVRFNNPVGELPVPALKGYAFTGWQDENGKIYTEDTIYDTEGDTVLYAQWDAAPVIKAIDRYYTLTSANNGRITRENLMSTASVTDDKDNPEDIEFKIADYSENDFKNLTADAQISITYKAVDSAGNKTYKKVFVHIVDTTPKKIEKTTYVRHISEKYYDKAFEDGGLEPDSVWRKNPEYAATLKRAMENRASITYARKYFRFLGRDFGYTDYGDMSVDHIEQHWEFTKEDRDKIRDFVNEHGIGNSKEPDALKKFYETFGYCRKY